eukprot:CAMPEP_0117012630 /NCGR_PEP_ID=MMETSP0472-20121206/10586_1 /TAXON_ID=693140 ORGANISM="Tiarina fusus, Strain LIS" /NCGR_SAMPLE_ID=MMETSP0472 /ASSEMBLY_ACC=CAM_ASM_000603 /LENGTH=384 /DNA_ID=CAMNT_0004715743 /DNA_START=131 /DNA_END=1285 /DNA_ORIENTATION=-
MWYLVQFFFVALVSTSFSSGDNVEDNLINAEDEFGRDLSLLEARYRIERPVFKYETLQFDLDYVVSDFMGDNFITYQIYDGHLCREGNNDITNNTYLAPRLRPDLKALGDGTGNRTMKLTLNIDPDEITSTSIFEDLETYANVYFCVRFNVHNMNYFEPQAIEVNFREVPVLLTINLVDGFSIDLGQVSDTDLVVELAYEDSAVEAYICDTDSNIINGDVRNQGESIRVCVTPTAETLAQGAYLRYIDEFTFQREEHLQVAIEPGNGGEAANELTVVSCVPGALVCAFETLLGAEFFADGVGIVYGYGTAFLQFGQEDEAATSGRRLQSDRLSAEELLAARPTAFGFEIVSIPVENEFASGTPVLATFSSATLLGIVCVYILMG